MERRRPARAELRCEIAPRIRLHILQTGMVYLKHQPVSCWSTCYTNLRARATRYGEQTRAAAACSHAARGLCLPLYHYEDIFCMIEHDGAISPENTIFVMLSFEGPDVYSTA